MFITKGKPGFLFIFFFFLLSSRITAEENKNWDIEKVVKIGLDNSYTVQTEKENLLKKRLYLKTVRFPENISIDLNSNVSLDWYPNDNLSFSPSLNVTLTVPVLPSINIISEYTLSESSSATDKTDNYGSLLVEMNIKPLQNLKKSSDYEIAFDNLNIESLAWRSCLIKTELDIRTAYINATETISALQLIELQLKNQRNIYAQNKKRFEFGLVSRNTLENNLLAKLKIENSFEKAKEKKYIALLKLSRLINVNLSKVKLQRLPEFKSKTLDRKKLIKSALTNNIQLKEALLQLNILKKSMNKMKNSFLPDITIIPAIKITDVNPEKWISKISVNMTLSTNFSNKYNLQKIKINLIQQERSINTIRHSIVDNIDIALYDFNIKQEKIKQLALLLNQKKKIYTRKKRAYEEKKLLATELETAKINVLIAENNLCNAWDDLWLAWYNIQAIEKGYIDSI